MLRRYRSKILGNESNTGAKEQKKEEGEQKVLVSKRDIELEVLPNSTEEEVPKAANVVSIDE